MTELIEQLDLLIACIKQNKETTLGILVQNYDDAITLSLSVGRVNDTKWIIDKYLNLFRPPIPFDVEFFCIFNLITIHWRMGKLDEAEEYAHQAMKLAEINERFYSKARVSMALGVLCFEKSHFAEAQVFMKMAEEGLREVRGVLLARCLNWLGQIAVALEQYQQSWSYYTEALNLNEELSLQRNQAYVLSNMGLLCIRMGLYKQAEDCFRSSIKNHEKLGNIYGLADSLANLGMLLLNHGKLYEKAAKILEKASKMQFDNNAISKAGMVLTHCAFALAHTGEKEKSDCLFNRAQKMVFSMESWSEQKQYYQLRADLYLSNGNLEEAENLVLLGKKIEEEKEPIGTSSDFNKIHSEILFKKGEYHQAYSMLLKSVEESNKVDSVKTSAMESVIYALTETAKTKKELLRIEKETKILEHNNSVLRLSEKRFRALVNRMTSIGVIAVNSDGAVTFWNDTCKDFYGYQSDEVIGVELIELIVPTHLHEWFTDFVNNRNCSRGFDVNLKTKDNKLKSVLVSLVALNENETFIIQVDQTSRRNAENQKSLIEAQMRRTQKLEALGTLAGGIAHDFNNLLQGILGNASMLCSSLEKESNDFSKVLKIKSAAERSADLCSQMLDYAGVKPVGHEILKINEVINDISLLLETSLPKGVALVTNFAKNLPPLMGDRSQIRQVVMNLILNGAESIEGIGNVQISTNLVYMTREQFEFNLLEESPAEGNYLFFEVSDTGSGIDPETLTRIFDPFFSTKKTGRGLGLAAVLGIVRGHSGAITVDSELGVGTKFRVYLRSTSTSEILSEKEPELFAHTDFSGKSILVVDDEEIVRETIHAILSLKGYKVKTVPGGAEALEVLKKVETPDLMLLDLTMPGLNGAEVFTRVRSMGMTFPILVVSGYFKDQISSLFPEKGPVGFLQKPFTADALHKKLLRIFNKLL